MYLISTLKKKKWGVGWRGQAGNELSNLLHHPFFVEKHTHTHTMFSFNCAICGRWSVLDLQNTAVSVFVAVLVVALY